MTHVSQKHLHKYSLHNNKFVYSTKRGKNLSVIILHKFIFSHGLW